jgi:adenylate kinase
VVVLVGPPGSGKGTQAKQLVAKHPDWIHVSTGDLFRAEIKSGSALGKSVQSTIDAGNLVSDDTTNEVFDSQLKSLLRSDNPQVVLLDGYPRTGAQTEYLLNFISRETGLQEPLVVEFDVADEVVVERLSGRRINPRTGRIYHTKYNPPVKAGICDEDGGELVQRPDDAPQVVRSRIQKYKETKKGILQGFEGKASFVRINAAQAPETLAGQLEGVIGEHSKVLSKN